MSWNKEMDNLESELKDQKIGAMVAQKAELKDEQEFGLRTLEIFEVEDLLREIQEELWLVGEVYSSSCRGPEINIFQKSSSDAFSNNAYSNEGYWIFQAASKQLTPNFGSSAKHSHSFAIATLSVRFPQYRSKHESLERYSEGGEDGPYASTRTIIIPEEIILVQERLSVIAIKDYNGAASLIVASSGNKASLIGIEDIDMTKRNLKRSLAADCLARKESFPYTNVISESVKEAMRKTKILGITRRIKGIGLLQDFIKENPQYK